MKKLPTLVLIALLACYLPLRAQQAPVSSNPYDTLGRVLTPIASVFTPEAANHALSLSVVLEEMTGLPPELLGARYELLLQPPEHLLIRGVYNGTPVALCRAGNSVWVSPSGAPFADLANPPGEPPRHKKKKAQGLEPMVLPFPPQQLALLPILFHVKEVAPVQGLRTLEVRLMPELAKSLGAQEWHAQMTLTPGEKLDHLRLVGPGWSMTVRIERLESAPSLPPETWRAPADAQWLDATQVEAWITELSRRVDTYRPAPNR
ncbi:MAG: hypothetical protein ACFUZC_00175 [Chthoniobacteraceae bacterium]